MLGRFFAENAPLGAAGLPAFASKRRGGLASGAQQQGRALKGPKRDRRDNRDNTNTNYYDVCPFVSLFFGGV